MPPPLPRSVLEYGRGPTLRPRPPADRGLFIVSAIVTTLIGTAILIAMADLLIVSWPSFGLILMSVPVTLVGLAFLSIAVTATRSAARS